MASTPEGTATFSQSALVVAFNTYVRFAFYALGETPTNNASTNPSTWYSSAPGGCFSVYSDPIPIMPALGGIEWVDVPLPSAVTCVADLATPLSPTPLAQVSGAALLRRAVLGRLCNSFCLPQAYYADGTAVPPGTLDSVAAVITVIDAGLQQYPSALGAMATSLLPNIPTDSLGTPLIRSALRTDQSPLLSPVFAAGDVLLPAVLNNVAGGLPLATLSAGLRTWDGIGYGSGTVPPILDASGVGGALLHPFNVSMARGAPGSYTLVAFAQGFLTQPWVQITCVDLINAVVVQDVGYANLTCPSAPAAYAPDGGSQTPGSPPNYISLGLLNVSLTCPHDCGAPLRGACVCGTCVCAPGWDGSADCSVPFHADGFSLVFATDPLYASRYGGLAVVDQRQQVRCGIGGAA